ncbi:MAG TPA: hypothetical protein DEQ64_05290 [Lachnoclostridium sp.]|uniref:amidohydrolase family protein n=1 Tax=Lacrimispora sp. TaxID=2719234 RepID=UPI000EE865F2|nr:amidohydrolase family protein [Lacrimispora sp.]HCD43139.1 hypothetical protein [Lachnoclostridium sp.]
MNQKSEKDQITAITNVRIFDGERVIDKKSVVIIGAKIQAVGGKVPIGATVIDGHGATLMLGLIDSHVHTDMNGLSDALKFGVTTELEMMGSWSKRQRKQIAERNDIADLRSPGMGITPPGGHPTEYMPDNFLVRLFTRFIFPFVKTPGQAVKFVDKQVAKGADYIKIFIEDGTLVGAPKMPTTPLETIRAAVKRAHYHGKMALVHVTTVEGTKQALEAGVDGLVHIFFDQPYTPELIDAIIASGVFVTPTLVVGSTAFGNNSVFVINLSISNLMTRYSH